MVPPSQADPRAPVRSTRQALAVYAERPTLVMMALGFAAGLPFLLIFDTLSAWLRDVGLSLEVIGFFSLATLVYSFKFLWAPLVDRTRVPWLTRRLGHRRSWMLACQIPIIVGLWLVSGRSPADELGLMAILAVLVGFSSATQDIAIDAWRIEVVDESRQGAMAAAYQWGYRVATLVAGALPLFMAESYGWNLSYGVMAGLMGLGVLATLAAPREARHTIRETRVDDMPRVAARDGLEWVARLGVLAAGALILGSGLAANASLLADLVAGLGLAGTADALLAAWRGPAGLWFQLFAVLAGFVAIAMAVSPVPGSRTRPGVYLGSALGDPLRDFFARYGRRARPILALICLYRLSDFLLNIMNPFYLDLGFTLTEVAEVRKIFGVAATMFGVFAAGYSIARFRHGAVAARRRGRRSAEQPGVRLAGHSGARARRALRLHRHRQRAERIRRHVPDRLHVESDGRRLHGHAVRALLVALRPARQDHRLAVGPYRRGLGAGGRVRRNVWPPEPAVRRPANRELRLGLREVGP